MGGGGSGAKRELYSTAVLYRFSTAIIKSVRHSTSHFLPTFPLIQALLSNCAFWPNSTPLAHIFTASDIHFAIFGSQVFSHFCL